MKSRGDSKITLQLREESIQSWSFDVFVSDSNGKHQFIVELDKEYNRQLTNDKVLPLVLIQESMFFLLERESVSTILKEFNLREIKSYFGDYESEIKKNLGI